MSATFGKEATRVAIASGRERYLTHTGDLMMVVIDFEDGPAAQPDWSMPSTPSARISWSRPEAPATRCGERVARAAVLPA